MLSQLFKTGEIDHANYRFYLAINYSYFLGLESPPRSKGHVASTAPPFTSAVLGRNRSVHGVYLNTSTLDTCSQRLDNQPRLAAVRSYDVTP